MRISDWSSDVCSSDLKLIESAPHPEYPWLRASLDGIYEIDGQIWIVDFKAPSESVLEEYRRTRDFGDYTWQLHHYRKAAEGKGIHVDGLVQIGRAHV